MHGSPLLRTLGVVAILLLTAFPLWKLTHPRAASIPIVSSTVTAQTKVEIGLIFVKPPKAFQLLHLGQMIWESRSPAETATQVFDMDFPKEGIDLEIKASWPEGTKVSAVQVSVTPGTRDPIRKSAWGQSTLDEVLTFHE